MGQQMDRYVEYLTETAVVSETTTLEFCVKIILTFGSNKHLRAIRKVTYTVYRATVICAETP
jgi:hypothetical protein